jgi:micrococcal nuclease
LTDQIQGITIRGEIERVTDGDTLRILADDRLFKVRVLGLDTEESNPNPHKPVTLWGKAATAFATDLLPAGTPVTMEFPGDAPVIEKGEIATRYLDNYQRPLAYVHLDAAVDGITDFSELMIRRGYSPYFVKYGRAVFAAHDARYAAAERAAQVDDIGVWNQLAANGVMTPEAAPRNYPRLMVWWELRARIIDGFRAARAAGADVLDAREDYAALTQRAGRGEEATVFMEVTRGTTVAGIHHVIRNGSLAQPFQLFLPDEDRPQVAAVKRLFANRYVADGEDMPRRNYAYVTGPLKLWRGRPEMVVEDAAQVSDEPPAAHGG